MLNELCLKKQHGFTLIEMISVMIIMGVVASVAIQKFDMLSDTAAEQALSVDLRRSLGARCKRGPGDFKKRIYPCHILRFRFKKMNGFELCGIIRKDSPSAFIYALSGNTELFSPHENRGTGFDDYFTKPVSLKALYKVAKASFEKIQRLIYKPLA